MDRKQKFDNKERELQQATNEIEKTVTSVKNLTNSVKDGVASKKELATALQRLDKLKEKVEFLTAETKMVGGFSVTQEHLPDGKNINLLWPLAIAVSAYILFLK